MPKLLTRRKLYTTWSEAVAHAQRTIPTEDMRVSDEAPDLLAAISAHSASVTRKKRADEDAKERARRENPFHVSPEQKARVRAEHMEKERQRHIEGARRRIVAQVERSAVVLKTKMQLDTEQQARELAMDAYRSRSPVVIGTAMVCAPMSAGSMYYPHHYEDARYDNYFGS